MSCSRSKKNAFTNQSLQGEAIQDFKLKPKPDLKPVQWSYMRKSMRLS